MAGTVWWRWILQNLTDKIVWDDYKAIQGERVNSVFSVAHASKYWQALVQNQIRKSKNKTWLVLVFAVLNIKSKFSFPELTLGLDIINLTHLLHSQAKQMCLLSLIILNSSVATPSKLVSVWSLNIYFEDVKTVKSWLL